MRAAPIVARWKTYIPLPPNQKQKFMKK